jgi:signal transduction histidine kinase
VFSPVEVAAVTRAGRPRNLERHVAGFDAPMLVVVAPASGSGLLVVAGRTLETVDSAVHRVELVLLVGGPLVVLVAAGAAWIIAGAALRPVGRMRREAAEISAHDGDGTLGVPGTRDELADLAETVNDLLRRLQAMLDRERSFVSAMGRELRTPLSDLQRKLELAGRPGRSAEQRSEAVASASEEVRRLARLAEDLLLLAQSDEGKLVVVPRRQPLTPLLELATAHIAMEARRRHVALKVTAPPKLEVPVDAAAHIGQVLDNLLDNALRFSPPGGAISVTASPQDDLVIVEIADQGPGSPTTTCHTSSNGSADPTPRAIPRATGIAPGPGWDWPSPGSSCKPTMAPSPPPTIPTAEPASAFACRPAEAADRRSSAVRDALDPFKSGSPGSPSSRATPHSTPTSISAPARFARMPASPSGPGTEWFDANGRVCIGNHQPGRDVLGLSLKRNQYRRQPGPPGSKPQLAARKQKLSRPPTAASQVVRSRPVSVYPLVVACNGSGDRYAASDF